MFNFQRPKNIQCSKFQEASNPVRFQIRFAVVPVGFGRRLKETISGKWNKITDLSIPSSLPSRNNMSSEVSIRSSQLQVADIGTSVLGFL